MYFILPLVLSFLPSILSLVAYDCNHKSMNLTTISLVTVPDCKLAKNNTKIESVKIAVTQNQEKSDIKFFRCLIEAQHIVTRCGKSIDTMYDGGFFTELIPMNKDRCKRMVEDNYIRIKKGSEFTEIQLTGKGFQRYNYLSKGSVDSDFSCTPGESFSRNNYRYDRPLVNTELKIIFTEGEGRINYEDDLITFPNGNQCKYSAGSCFSSEYGYLYWDLQKPICSMDQDQKSLVFKGKATLITLYKKEPIQYIQVEYGGYSFQIELRDRFEQICGFQSHLTEHPKLYVTILPSSGPDFPNLNTVNDLDVSLLNYINSKLVYSMRHITNEVNRLFNLFQLERCRTNNRVTKNLLAIAMLSPVNFAYVYGGPGYTAVQRGEVMYLAKCKPVVVIFDLQRDGCYNEIPVIYENKTAYVTPRTRIIMDYGNKVDCVPEMAPKYNLDGKWYHKSDHGLVEVKAPQSIIVDDITYEFTELKSISNEGLYTQKTMERFQSILTSPLIEKVINTGITNAIINKDNLPDGINFSNAFSDLDYHVISSKVTSWLSKMEDTAKNWGSWFGFILLCLGGFKLFIYLIGCLINFRLLKTEFNLITAVFCCWLDSLTHMMMHKTKKSEQEDKYNLNEIRATKEELELVIQN